MTKHRNKPASHRGGYQKRLEQRGLKHTPAMPTLEELQKKQAQREKQTGSPYPDPDPEKRLNECGITGSVTLEAWRMF